MSDQNPMNMEAYKPYFQHKPGCYSRTAVTAEYVDGKKIRQFGDCDCDLEQVLSAFAAHVEVQRPGKVLTNEAIDLMIRASDITTHMDLAQCVDIVIRKIRDNGYLAPAQPIDPDAHITDQDAYLKAKIERAKDVDFDGIEAERVDPVASHMEHCRTLVDAQPDETLADAIERLMASQKSMSVDKIMGVYHEHEQWFNLHGGTPAKRSGNFKARLNKLIG